MTTEAEKLLIMSGICCVILALTGAGQVFAVSHHDFKPHANKDGIWIPNPIAKAKQQLRQNAHHLVAHSNGPVHYGNGPRSRTFGAAMMAYKMMKSMNDHNGKYNNLHNQHNQHFNAQHNPYQQNHYQHNHYQQSPFQNLFHKH